jgi:hypothetical protein
MKEKKTRYIILKNETFIRYIIKGISNISANNNAERIILRILTVFQRTINENEKEFTKVELEEEEKNRENIKNIFNIYENKIIFFDIIHKFCKSLNLKLKTYCTDLENCKHYCINSNFFGDISRYNNNLKSSFKAIISVINIYEFLLNVSQECFFNTEILDLPLIYIRNFFVTLTSKILINDEYHISINTKCKDFINDDILKSLCSLYVTLFEDYKLSKNNSLGWKIYFFMREKKLDLLF